MNEKELKRLSRRDLLEIMLAQKERIESLEKELKKTKSELNSKKINISESGSIAEASLKISGIFEKAQEAITIYQNNIDALNKEIKDKIEKEYEKEKNKKLKEIDKECKKKLDQAKKVLDEAKKKAKDTKKVKKSK